jgi:hypothetical protein
LFQASSLPTAFLIDKNGIIQWKGHASRLTTELIDEFLKNGCIETKKKLRKNLKAKGKRNNQQKKEMSLMINELPVPNFEYAASEKFYTDTFECIYNQYSIKNIIENLREINDDRIIYNIPNELLNKRISVKYFTTNCNVQKTKKYLLNSIAQLYSFSLENKNIDTLVWKITVVDTMKLHKNRTIMTSKIKGMGKGKGGSGTFAQKESIRLNFSLPELATEIEKDYNIICESSEISDTAYDFIKINGSTFESFRNDLFEKCGLNLTSSKKRIEFTIIDNISIK